VTTPAAMDVATSVGGSGRSFSNGAVLQIIGRASHAIGTAKAMENSQLEGAVDTVAMVMSAVLVSVLGPVLIIVLI